MSEKPPPKTPPPQRLIIRLAPGADARTIAAIEMLLKRVS